MISEETICVERSMRYSVREASGSTELLLYLLHGYGQLSRYFIRKAEELPANITVVAPEGMHRFYLNGHSGRVGACWMTKEARELDICENTAALNQLHEALKLRYRPIHIAVAGFSQGGATAARWVADDAMNDVNLFVSWASVFPPDLKLPDKSSKLGRSNVFVVGTNDEFFSAEAVLNAVREYEALGFSARTFDGAHDLDSSVLQDILREFIK